MRLTELRRYGIIAAFIEMIGEKAFRDGHVVLYLYGSRTDTSLHGGDIDLLLLCSSGMVEPIKIKKRSIIVAIGKKIGECRIDLTIAPLAQTEQSEFVQTVLPGAIVLYPENTGSK